LTDNGGTNQEAGRLQDRLRKLDLLLDVYRELALELDLDRLLRLVVARATQVMDADRSSLYVVDRERQEVWTKVAQGVGEIRLALGQGIAGKVAATGESVNVADAYTVAEFDASWDRRYGYKTRSLLCIPLLGRNGEVIGVFEALNKCDGHFVQEDEALLVALGAGVAVALENALLVEALRQANRKISEAYDQLLHSEKLSMLGLLAGTVAHDIQNPLGVILGQSEVLMRKRPQDTDVARAATSIIGQVERVSELVSSVQNFSRKGSEEFSPVDVHRVLREALVLTERLLTRSRITLERDYEENLPAVWGNANRLEQVFMNLIQNAAQAMEGGGQLRISSRRLSGGVTSEDRVEIGISDTGGGVTGEDVAHIFDAFFTTKSERKGTGLGLAICRHIVKAHMGDIELSNRPGYGATFLVRLQTSEGKSPP